MQKPVVLNAKDKKILASLETNARQPESAIAKQVGLSKQVVNYRIKHLEKQGVIESYYTIINTGKLGYNTYYVFIQLEHINKRTEQEILEKIRDLSFIGWLVSGIGRWDAIFLIYAESNTLFDKCLGIVFKLCGTHLHEYNFTTLIAAEHISYRFLKQETEGRVFQTEKTEIATLDKIDQRLLKEISQNARLPALRIAALSGFPTHTVTYHLKQLREKNIIEGFKPKINVARLGYQWHLLLVQFHRDNEERLQAFINYCKKYQHIYYVTHTIGYYNLMLDIHTRSIEEFKEVLLDLKDKFSDVIKLYESFIVFEEYKIDYLPPLS
ncbi:MAG: winged helix-turn-helix transcriptional regulator [Nanoarchaeota archaeon]